jgi:hypothetical protein
MARIERLQKPVAPGVCGSTEEHPWFFSTLGYCYTFGYCQGDR